MELYSLKYKQDEGVDREWGFDGLSLHKINLIVGKNASGKSRTLNVMGLLQSEWGFSG